MQGRSGFADLPIDIKALVVGYISRPTDLVNLCLTSKQLQEIAVRQLYHTVSLDVGSSADNKLPAFINPSNIGLKYVRRLELYRDRRDVETQDRGGSLHQANFAIRMLLEFLPPNTVEKFSWHTWCRFGAENLVLLYKRQKKLKWLEAISLDKPLDDELRKELNFDSITQEVSRLGLYPDSRSSLEFCHELIRRVKNPELVILQANFDEYSSDDEDDISSRELNDSSTGPGLIASTIFRHMMPFKDCTPIRVRELTLQKISLRYSQDTYAKIFSLPQLRTIKVLACAGADALFAQLSRSSSLPDRLDVLEFKHTDDSQDSEAMNALEGFLCLVSGIRSLTVDVAKTNSLPSVASVTRHSRTLKLLNVHATTANDFSDPAEEEHVYDVVDFRKICEECKNLEQISAAFPSTSILRASSDDFELFTRAINQHAELVTVNISTWPTNTPTGNCMPRQKYEALLRDMAQGSFEGSIEAAREARRMSKLNVVAFGSSDRHFDRDSGKSSAIFVKGKQLDALGRQSPLAIRMEWGLRRYAEPRSESLDYKLLRTIRPPTREPMTSDNLGWGD